MFRLQNILHIRISAGTKFQLNFDFLDQIYPKRVFPIKNGKSEHHQWILHTQISLSTKFHFKESSLNFRTKFAQKVYFPSKKYVKITTEFSILKLVYNTWQTFWDQSPSPHYQCCLQVSETVSWHKLRCCCSSNILQHWVKGSCLIYFCKGDHSRVFINFSRIWLGLDNLCEILCVLNLSLKRQYSFFGPNMPKKSISSLKEKK